MRALRMSHYTLIHAYLRAASSGVPLSSDESQNAKYFLESTDIHMYQKDIRLLPIRENSGDPPPEFCRHLDFGGCPFFTEYRVAASGDREGVND